MVQEDEELEISLDDETLKELVEDLSEEQKETSEIQTENVVPILEENNTRVRLENQLEPVSSNQIESQNDSTIIYSSSNESQKLYDATNQRVNFQTDRTLRRIENPNNAIINSSFSQIVPQRFQENIDDLDKKDLRKKEFDEKYKKIDDITVDSY